MSFTFGRARLAVLSALLLFAPSMASLFAPESSAQTSGLTISGRVTEAAQGGPLAGVTVTLTDSHLLGGNVRETRTTGADGTYSFNNLAAGANYGVFASKPGYFFNPNFLGYGGLSASQTANFTGTASPPSATVQFSAPNYDAREADGGADLTVTLSAAQTFTTTVQYETQNGTANSRSDFMVFFGVVTFAPGETSKSVRVLLTDDRFAETNETLTVSLSNPSGAALGARPTATVTIIDNDAVSGQSPVAEGPSFDANFFVRQHYLDFLNREPDAAGLAFWAGQTTGCNNPDPRVCRINVSAAFFLSIEFQETGYFVYRFYKAAYGDSTSPGVPGTVPVIRLEEFLPGTQRLGRGVQVGIGDWQAQLEANKAAFADSFVTTARFTSLYPTNMSPAEFVDRLNQNAGAALSPAERDALVNELTNGVKTRAQVLRAVAEDDDLKRAEFNRAFVLMQYYGYLRRNPDDPQDRDFSGWKFWLDQLNRFNGDFRQAEMVRAFIESLEYKGRFGL
jgi:hypothetical protein